MSSKARVRGRGLVLIGFGAVFIGCGDPEFPGFDGGAGGAAGAAGRAGTGGRAGSSGTGGTAGGTAGTGGGAAGTGGGVAGTGGGVAGTGGSVAGSGGGTAGTSGVAGRGGTGGGGATGVAGSAGGSAGAGGAAGAGGVAGGAGGRGGAGATGGTSGSGGGGGRAGAGGGTAGGGGAAGTGGVAGSASGGRGGAGGRAGNGGSGGGTAGSGGGTAGQSGSGGGGQAGASGGTAGGGTAGAGGAATMFAGGPCATSTDLTSIEVFARGSDRRFYRKLFNGSSWGSWVHLTDLDNAMIDVRSDLDCAANANAVHLVASGSNPIGAYMHAVGTGTTYNPFFREITTQTFDPSPSITVEGASTLYQIAAVSNGNPYEWEVNGTASNITPPITTVVNAFTSSSDIVFQPHTGYAYSMLAAFDASGALALYGRSTSAGSGGWNAPTLIPPPSGTTYQFSPTVCADSASFPASGVVHLAAVAGGKLWHTSASDAITFGAWEQIAPAAASAPDCVFLTGGAIDVVVLTAAGSVLDVHGTTGSWTATSLGSY